MCIRDSHQVGEHVRGDDRVAEKVQQHDLERAQENERERQPDHYARTAQCHAPHHIKSHRHQYQRLDRPYGVGSVSYTHLCAGRAGEREDYGKVSGFHSFSSCFLRSRRRSKLSLIHIFERVAQYVGHLRHGFRGPYDHHAVAALQFQALLGDQIDARAVYARDGDAVFLAQVLRAFVPHVGERRLPCRCLLYTSLHECKTHLVYY